MSMHRERRRYQLAAVLAVLWSGLCATRSSAAVDSELPGPEYVRAGLTAASERLHSAKWTVQQDWWLESADAARKGTVVRLQQELALDGPKFFQRTYQETSPAEDQLFATTGDTARLWLRNPIGPGVGKIRPPEAEEVNGKLGESLPYIDLKVRFGFDAARTPFRVTGWEKVGEVPVLRIEWEHGEGSTRSQFAALVSPQQGFLPLRIDEKVGSTIRRSVEVVSAQGYGDVWLPTEVVQKNYAKLSEIRAGFSDDKLPPSISPDEMVANVGRSLCKFAQVNEPIDPKIFDFQWAYGTEILDQNKGLNWYYGVDLKEAERATLTDMTLARQQGLLDKAVAVAEQQQRATVAAPPQALGMQQASGTGRWTLWIVGAAVAAVFGIGIGIFYYHRRGRARTIRQ